jgi:ABC-type polysaccharide/polyol phosphate transport system ATPase subunit
MSHAGSPAAPLESALAAAPRAERRDDVVVVRGLSKVFHHPHERVHTLKERAMHPFRPREFDRFQALRDVSFSVAGGEFFGIVGRNGSGKSTLLKCLAGIYRADSGVIEIGGRLSTFIELGVGFNPDLAARDNVVINGIMLGLTPREARARFDDVIEFAELEDFVDLKLKNYSSGMQVRLAFSVMVQVDADILLIDEVLAVGDAAFQQKCFDVFHRLKDEGKTILFVTHDMSAVQRFCDRAMLLERGDVKLIDEPERVGNHYVELNFGRDEVAHEEDGGIERFGSQAAQIVEAWFEDGDGRRTTTLRQGAVCSFRMRIRFEEDVEGPSVAVLIENEQHHPLFATSNDDAHVETGLNRAGDEAIFSVTFQNPIGPGRIYASPWIRRPRGGDVLDRRPRIASAIVTALKRTGSLVDLPHDVDYERVGRATGRAAG